jgi:hypothetical protein
MKYKNKIFSLIIILLVVISCCKKNNPTPNILKGKIRMIELSQSSMDYSFLFFYDSVDGVLQKITSNNKLYVSISKKINNSIVLDYDLPSIDSSTNEKIRLKAYLDNNNFIKSIVKIDTNNLSESLIITFNNTNGKPDSILENPLAVISNSKLYDFTYVNNNIYKLVRSYDNSFSGEHIDTLYFSYTNKKLTSPQIPSQKIYSYNTLLGYGGTIATDPVYLLELNGYKCYKSNENLVDSIYTINSSGNNIISRYNYTISNEEQILEMQVTDNISSIFKFKYY